MKVKTVYVAADGKTFDNKKDCITYEKGGVEELKRKERLQDIRLERQQQIALKDHAYGWMQVLKSKPNLDERLVEPTIGNIIGCLANLSRIEAIYTRAKKQFFKDINTPGLSLKKRANRIYHSAHILDAAIDKREEILARWYECKKDIDEANKRLRELEKEEDELKMQEKTNE